MFGVFLPVLIVFTAAFFIYSKLLVERYRVTNVSNPLYVSLFFWSLDTPVVLFVP